MSSLNFLWWFIAFPCVLSLVHQREEISTFPSTAHFEQVIHADEVTPQPSILQSEQIRGPQLHLMNLGLTALHHCDHINWGTQNYTQNQKYAGLKGAPSGSSSPTSSPMQDAQGSHRVPENIVQTPLELRQSRCCDHFPGESGPVPSHPLGEKPFSDTQTKPPLTQLHAVSLSHVTDHKSEKTCPPLPLVRMLRTTIRSSINLHQAEQSKWPQLLLIRLALETLHHLLALLWMVSNSLIYIYTHMYIYMFYIVVPKTAHSSQGKAVPAQSRVRQPPV